VNSKREPSTKDSRIILLGMGLILLGVITAKVHAEDYLNLPVVKPVISCDQLGKADLSSAVSAAVTIQSAVVTDTAKGQFCRITGNIEPGTIFEVDLPLEHWTQRLLGNPSNVMMIADAPSCAPAQNGEFVTAYDNQGHTGTGMEDASWTPNLQMRIDWAYRSNHETALAAKALIKAFYGQPQRFSYFIGCSEGGRQALVEAQRFPEDYDGVVAGSPRTLDTHRDLFGQTWEGHINRRADGSRILVSSRTGIIHDALILHCAAKSGVLDGVLQDPSACKFDPAWVQCPAGATDTTKCLTAEEANVAQKLFEGSSDNAGHRFDVGMRIGGGLMLGGPPNMPANTGSAKEANAAKPQEMPGSMSGKLGADIRRLLPPPESDKSAVELGSEFSLNQEWFDKLKVLAPLYNAANTNLRPFEKHGGKLILWGGAQDGLLPIDYYDAVVKYLGFQETDTFTRLFALPGVGHCMGGDNPSQFDLLTPIMAWTELHRAPAKIVAGKVTSGQGGQEGTGVANGPSSAWEAHSPLATPSEATVYTRPVFPYPYIAHYAGKGDPNDEASYEPVRSGAVVPEFPDVQTMKLFAPDNQKFYHVENGQLVPDAK